MGFWLLIQALILGIVEGLTEFLPVSSTGHLIVVGDAIGFTGERAKTFEIFIQLGSILGVVWFYRAKLRALAAGFARRGPEVRLAGNVLIAFLPAALLGLLLHKQIKTYLFSPLTVAGALIAGGLLILLIEAWYRRRPATAARLETLEAISATVALKVGLAQCCSLFPGVSRAGATIMGGLVVGLDRRTATEFSFFLAMPTMFAATLYELYKSRSLLDGSDVPLFAVGFVTAFLTALVVVKLFLDYVGRHSFVPFAWYRIGFGLAVLAYFWPA
jgi:undecaprenyl-diphosphatase